MKPANEELLGELIAHVGRADIVADVHAVYAEAAEAIAAGRSVCDLSGRCCRFAEFGHCLYVTSPELICFLTDIQSAPSPSPIRRALAALPDADPGELCPFQVGRLCGARAIRPLGCRMFYCRPDDDAQMKSQFETFQGRMKQICRARELPYGYFEWTGALAVMVRAGVITPNPVDA